MPPIFKGIVTVSVWILFLKGLLAVVMTLYVLGRTLFAGESLYMVAAAGCAVGAFAFILACIGVWIRQKIA